MRIYKLLFSILVLISVNSFSQNFSTLENDLEKKIDQLLPTKTNVPGISFAIMYKGEVVYKKSFGLADYEQKIPITSDTKFNIAHMSKHFTAYAILELINEGRLSLEDKVVQYLPEIGVSKSEIKVKHLLTHSSGLYGYESLKPIVGWSTNDVFTQKDALKLVASQEKLMYKPGTDFSYSNIHMILLAEIIKKVTKSSYKDFMEKEIFQPLGMNHTIVEENQNVLIQNRAKAYGISDENMVYNYNQDQTLGSRNIYSTINDLIRWQKHLSSSPNKTKMLYKNVQLASGRVFSVSSGILNYGQQYGHKERGIPKYYMTGGAGGYDSSIFHFPNQEYTAIALTNNGEGYNGYLGMQASYFFLEKDFLEPPTTDFSKIAIKLSKKALMKFVGNYWSDMTEGTRSFVVKKDTLRYVRAGYESVLIPIAKNRFQMKVWGDDKIYFDFSIPGTYQYINGEAEPVIYKKFSPKRYENTELKRMFSGTYVNKTLNITFRLDAFGNTLILKNSKTNDITFSPIHPLLFSSNAWYMRSIEFVKDNNGAINGFYIRNNTIRNLWFEKL